MFEEYVKELDSTSILEDDTFDELFEIEDELARAKAFYMLQTRAKELGKKTEFLQLYKIHKKTFDALMGTGTAAEPVKSDYVANFSGVNFESPLRTGRWQASDQGIFAVTDNGIVCACPHPIYPEKILVNAETEMCKVVLRFKKRNIWKSIPVNKDIVSSNTKIISLANYGIAVNSDSARALIKYLAEVEALNQETIVEIQSTSRLGWLSEEVFMPYENNVVFDNEVSLRSVFESIKEHGSEEKWLEMAKEIRQQGKFENLIYIASSLASGLVEPCGALPFIVSLWGDTGSGKTVALMLATSIWANPAEGQYMADAKATSTALEIRLNALNSLPMTLDDMAQVRNQYDGDFADLIYRWCAGKGKERSNVNLGLSTPTHWSNCTLTNSEFSLINATTQGGAVNRIIDVEMTSEKLFLDGNYVATACRNNYGFCGKCFIETIKAMGWEKVRELQKKWFDLLKEKNKDSNKEEKQLLPMSIILTADEIVEEAYFKDGVRLPVDKCFEILKGHDEVSENVRAIEFLQGSVVSNMAKFMQEDKVFVGPECWGKINGNTASIVGTTFTKLMKEANVQEKAFLSWADRKNLLYKSSDGKNRKKVKLGEKSARCVVIRLWDDEEFVELDEGEETPFS